MSQVSAIIPAAGTGARFGEPKQFKSLAGLPLLFHCLSPFFLSKTIKEIILIVQSNKIEFTKKGLQALNFEKKVKVVIGGQERQDSVKNGILAPSNSTKLVCIHDAARPFVTENLINKSVSLCKSADGAVIACPSVDTVKLNDNGFIRKTLDRNDIWLAQTPQTFKKEKLIKAINNADNIGLIATDESVMMEEMGYSIKLVKGDENNFKITTMHDWIRAESLL